MFRVVFASIFRPQHTWKVQQGLSHPKPRDSQSNLSYPSIITRLWNGPTWQHQAVLCWGSTDALFQTVMQDSRESPLPGCWLLGKKTAMQDGMYVPCCLGRQTSGFENGMRSWGWKSRVFTFMELAFIVSCSKWTFNQYQRISITGNKTSYTISMWKSEVVVELSFPFFWFIHLVFSLSFFFPVDLLGYVMVLLPLRLSK